MEKVCAKCKSHALTALIVSVICLFCIFALSACDSEGGKVKESEKSCELYFAGLLYSEDDGVMTAVVAMSGDEQSKLGSVLEWKARTYALDTWYVRQDVKMSVNPSELMRELDGLITDEQRVHDDKEYNRLKVALRYDTIYKSISSDASVTKSGKHYLHTFELDEELEEQTCEIRLKSQNTANWYAILIACGIAFAAVITCVSLAIKGGIWQKKKKKNE